MVVFAQVVEQGSLTAAAKHIGLSRAVVSYHIKKLESQLGVKLLNRSTRSIALTEAGSEYYQSCRIIAEQAATANQQIENLKSEPEGLLKIALYGFLGGYINSSIRSLSKLFPRHFILYTNSNNAK
nr:LysR family transcriptional regulator [Zooshikella ganghwensis]